MAEGDSVCISVKVPTLGSSHIFKVDKDVTIRQLFVELCTRIDIQEKRWFGLKYQKNPKRIVWLPGDKEVSSLKVPLGEENVILEFAVRFYPTDFENQVFKQSTLNFFFRQIHKDIVEEPYVIDFPREDLFTLAALKIQAENLEDECSPGFITRLKLLPEHIVQSSNVSRLEHEIFNEYEQIDDISKEKAMKKYLKLAQSLDIYGYVPMYPITDKSGLNPMLLAIGPYGCSIFNKKPDKDEYVFEVNYSYEDLHWAGYERKDCKIVFKESVLPPKFSFKCRKSLNKKIVETLLSYHQFWILFDPRKGLKTDSLS